MKTCPVCALDLEDSYLFCPDDGSSLDSATRRSLETESASPPLPSSGSPGVVLYCPACAAEYPLTFSSCPVHGLPLTKHRIARPSSGVSGWREPDAGACATGPAPEPRRDASRLTKQLTTLDLRRPQIDAPNPTPRVEAADVPSEILTDAPVNSDESFRSEAFAGGTTAFDYQEASTESSEGKLERPGFRVAAIATVIALVLFGLVAIYTFISNFSRRSPSTPGKTASTQSAVQPLPFVPTPQEAQDYKEEPPVTQVVPASPAEQPSEPRAERIIRNDTPSSTEPARKNTGAQHMAHAAPVAAAPPEVRPTRVSNTPMPALPRGNSGGFDARLIRVRSIRTPEGFRYDLTFNMQEQAGRAAHWQRVLISTRSASGASHSEAIPFSHRLGAAGALTFTISVELTGRAEADWQGRVVCTTLGWDNKGAPLQASFGANVNP